MNLTRVTNATFNELQITISVFSLQDALFPNSVEAKLWDYDTRDTDYIFADACQQPDGSQNCTTSCIDPSTMFVNLQTMHNCMVFDKVAAHVYDMNLTDTAYTLVQELGIAPIRNDSTKKSRTAKGMIQTCLTDLCTSMPGCENEFTFGYSDDYPTPYKNASNYDFDGEGDNLVEYICNYFPSQVTEEIGGIGVGLL